MEINWHTEKRAVRELVPHPDNPRSITAQQHKALTSSLKKFNLAEIPVINTENTILAGHQRVSILMQLGRGSELIEVRVPDRVLTEEESKEYLIRSNKNTGEWNMEKLKDFTTIGNLTDWGFEDFKDFDLATTEKEEVKDEEEVKEEEEEIDNFVGDVIYPSDNQYDIPTLSINVQATTVELPFNRWGSLARSSRMEGTYHFYTDDYKFDGLWKHPEMILNSNCKATVEPNFSTNDQMPFSVALYNMYKKRWISKYFQTNGIKIFIDLAVAKKFRDIALVGVPKGWKSYATCYYPKNYELEKLLGDWEQAKEHAGTSEINFIVYGGGEKIKELAKEKLWYYFEQNAQAVHKKL